MNKEGIDISNLIKYNVEWPKGLKENTIKVAFDKFLQEGPEEYQERFKNYHWKSFGKDDDMILKAIAEYSQKKNNGKISLEDFAKLNMIDASEYYVAELFLKNNNNDLNLFCENIANIIEILEKCQGVNGTRLMVDNLLQKALHKQYTNKEYEEKGVSMYFKEECIHRITGVRNKKKWNNTDELKKNILGMKDWEYYENNRIVVNSNNGEIVYIQYGMGDGANEKFCTEVDEKGKYVLKGYTENEQGEQTELDVGLGRNFWNDTTQIDREIIEKTSNIKAGEIRSTMIRLDNIMKTNEEKEKYDRNEQK